MKPASTTPANDLDAEDQTVRRRGYRLSAARRNRPVGHARRGQDAVLSACTGSATPKPLRLGSGSAEDRSEGQLTPSAFAALVLLLLVSSPLRALAHDPALTAPLPALPQYLFLGVEHVWLGYDHVAFLVGVMLLARTRGSLLKAVTAFTLAHSLSLSACVLGVVTPPVPWVEAAIALSIVYVALAEHVQRTRRTERAAGRAELVSGVFGLVHGFGFASALEDIGVPLDSTAAALALFNLGVELGQLLLLLPLLPLLSIARARKHGVTTIRWALLGVGVVLTATRIALIIDGDPPQSIAVGLYPATAHRATVAAGGAKAFMSGALSPGIWGDHDATVSASRCKGATAHT